MCKYVLYYVKSQHDRAQNIIRICSANNYMHCTVIIRICKLLFAILDMLMKSPFPSKSIEWSSPDAHRGCVNIMSRQHAFVVPQRPSTNTQQPTNNVAAHHDDCGRLSANNPVWLIHTHFALVVQTTKQYTTKFTLRDLYVPTNCCIIVNQFVSNRITPTVRPQAETANCITVLLSIGLAARQLRSIISQCCLIWVRWRTCRRRSQHTAIRKATSRHLFK